MPDRQPTPDGCIEDPQPVSDQGDPVGAGAWRTARCIDTRVGLGQEVLTAHAGTTLYYIGDARHAATGRYPTPGASDHNPCQCHSVVCAVDIMTTNGPDLPELANYLAGRAATDTRIKYVIYNRRIASGPNQGHPAGVWRTFGGDPHTDHVHLSVQHPDARFDSVVPWRWPPPPQPKPQPTPAPAPSTAVTPPLNLTPLPLLRQGSRGQQVRNLQGLLVGAGRGAAVDGVFGPKTRATLVAWQAAAHLTPDGVCGPHTWGTLIGHATVLRVGARGQQVRNLQGLLVGAGRAVAVDGVFGPKTAATLREWQGAAHLAADGVCGRRTWCTLLGAR